MKLGKHFFLTEFCQSQSAVRYGIPMNPPPYVVANLKSLVGAILDPLRDELGVPIVITSGWRPSALNSLIGGATRSQHVQGQAADITVPGLAVIEVCHVIQRLFLPYDQLIYEFGSWTHVSYNTVRRRGEVLTAKRVGRRTEYITGLPK